MDDIGIEPVYLLKDRNIPAATQETGANNLIVARGTFSVSPVFYDFRAETHLYEILPKEAKRNLVRLPSRSSRSSKQRS